MNPCELVDVWMQRCSDGGEKAGFADYASVAIRLARAMRLGIAAKGALEAAGAPPRRRHSQHAPVKWHVSRARTPARGREVCKRDLIEQVWWWRVAGRSDGPMEESSEQGEEVPDPVGRVCQRVALAGHTWARMPVSLGERAVGEAEV